MPKVYNFPLNIRNPELIEQHFSLYQLMHGISDHEDERIRLGDCYVTGIKFVQNGTPKFEELIEKERGRYERMELTTQKIEKILEILRAKDKIIVTTNFAAVATPASMGRLDGCPYRAFVTNFRSLAIIHPEEKQISIVPYEEDRWHRNLFYDIRGSKMAGVRWQYDGTIADALTEFNGTYTFNIGRTPRNSEEDLTIKNSHPGDYSRNYIITGSNIPLEEVIGIVTQKY